MRTILTSIVSLLRLNADRERLAFRQVQTNMFFSDIAGGVVSVPFDGNPLRKSIYVYSMAMASQADVELIGMTSLQFLFQNVERGPMILNKESIGDLILSPLVIHADKGTDLVVIEQVYLS